MGPRPRGGLASTVLNGHPSVQGGWGGKIVPAAAAGGEGDAGESRDAAGPGIVHGKAG